MLNSQGSISAHGTHAALVESGRLDAKLYQISPKAQGQRSKDTAGQASKPLPTGVAGPTENDIEELNRRTGDVSLYKYYAIALGWKISLGLIIAIFYNAVAGVFPRQLSIHHY